MSAAAQTTTRDGLLHIGAVCNQLRDDFPDVSISKIRYLEDQGLIHPKRTRGGYRLFDDDTVERLRTILRLQRDEFLPLRVIRQELASPGRTRRAVAGGPPVSQARRRSSARARSRSAPVRRLSSCASSRSTDCSCRDGIAPRNLRAFRTAADREASLLGQLVGPSLRTRNPERREAALDDLRALAELAQELSQLLSWRALRHLASA